VLVHFIPHTDNEFRGLVGIISATSVGCTTSVGRQYHGLCRTTRVGCKFQERGAELKNGISAPASDVLPTTSVGCRGGSSS